jgi:hypothetical protein
MSRSRTNSPLCLLLAAAALLGSRPLPAADHPLVIVIHGGAGVIERARA